MTEENKTIKSKKFFNYNPPTAVDLVIENYQNGIFKGLVFIKRKNEPYKDSYALPGGFQEMWESLEDAGKREGKEETGLVCKILKQMKTYSNPDRDPRGHVNGIGFWAEAEGVPKAGDDAAEVYVFPVDKIPSPLAFDHDKRIFEYLALKSEDYRIRKTD